MYLVLQSFYCCMVTARHGVEVHYIVKMQLVILSVGNFCVLSRNDQYDAL